MAKSKAPDTPRSRKGGFGAVPDMREFLENRGDLRAVFDQVHRHFFDQLIWPDSPLPRVTGKKPQ